MCSRIRGGRDERGTSLEAEEECESVVSEGGASKREGRERDVDELALGGCRSEVDTKSIRESSFLDRDVDRDIVPGRDDGGWRLERNEGEPA